ncbi:hypothetical protein X767_04815 [Mesorhizobium sp. LSJC264A00]|nr:hypothetical protein X767_04815 [Mesorhizobium sp. LSJC264A00]
MYFFSEVTDNILVGGYNRQDNLSPFAKSLERTPRPFFDLKRGQKSLSRRINADDCFTGQRARIGARMTADQRLGQPKR